MFLLMIRFVNNSGMKISGDWRYWLTSSKKSRQVFLPVFLLNIYLAVDNMKAFQFSTNS